MLPRSSENMPDARNPGGVRSMGENSPEKQKQQQEQRNKDLAEMAKRDRQRRIAEQLEKAYQGKQKRDRERQVEQEQNTQEKDQAQEQPQTSQKLFTTLANEMIEQRMTGTPREQQSLARLELAVREMNRVRRFENLDREAKIAALKEQHELRSEAARSLQIVRELLSNEDFTDFARTDITPGEAMQVLDQIQGFNDETYAEIKDEVQEGGEVSDTDIEEIAKIDKEVKQEEIDKSKEKKEQRLETNIEKRRKARAERVSKYKSIKKIEKRIKQLREKGVLTAEEQEEVEALEQRKTEIIIEQFETYAKETIIDNLGNDTDIRIIEKLSKDDIQILLDRQNLLPSEENRLRQIQSSDGIRQELLKVVADREQTLQDYISQIQDSNKQKEVLEYLEILVDPRIAGRAEMDVVTEKTEEDVQRIEDEAQEFANYQEWLRTGAIGERLSAAREDFMTKIITLNVEQFDEMDLYMTLQEYNLASVTYDEESGQPRTEFNQDLTEEQQTQLQELVTRTNELRLQHELAWDLVGYGETDDVEAPMNQSRLAVLDSLSQGLNSITETETTSGNPMRDLFEAGVIDLEVTPTGISVIAKGRLAGKAQEETFNAFLKQIGVKEEAFETVKKEGLGATLEESVLQNLQEHIAGLDIGKREEYKDILPSVNIIIAGSDYPIDTIFSTQRHETVDYLLDELDNNQFGDPETNRAMRELSSRISDGTIGREGELSHTTLDRLYVSRPESGEIEEKHKALDELVRTFERIITAQRGTDEDPLINDIEEEILRSQLAFKLRELLKEQTSDSEIGARIRAVNNELLKEYDLEEQQDVEDIDEIFDPSYEEVVKNQYHKHIKYATPAKPSFVGIADTSNPLNKVQKEVANTAQYGGAPAPNWYGAPGEAAYNTRWEHANEGWGLAPIGSFRGFRTLAKMPVVGTVLRNALVPLPSISTYGWKRTMAARQFRSTDPILRRQAQIQLGNADLGSNPGKLLGVISPELEHRAKQYLPGWLAAHKIDEERENLPASMSMGVYDHVYDQAPQLMIQVGVGDAKLGQQDMLRYINALPGVKYEFSGQQYQFGKDQKSMMETTQTPGAGLSRIEKKASGLFDADPSGKAEFAYKYQDKRYKPTEGMLRSMLKGHLRMGTGELQGKVSKFFKKNARRSDLPGYKRERMYHWERELGSEFREYLQRRDGYVALQTLENEHNHFEGKGKGENYSLFELANLVHYGEEQLVGNKWLTNDSGKTLKLTINERGQTRTVKVEPGDFLRDEWGNLIPDGVKLEKSGGEFDIVGGKLRADLTNEKTQGLWGRLVGDYENPYLRFIRLNSQDSRDFALDKFGTDLDDGYDPNNVRLRTDGIKWAIKEMNYGLMDQIMKEGVPPDRRYAMEFMDTKKEGKIPVVKIDAKISLENGPTIETFTTNPATGDEIATNDFIDLLRQRLNILGNSDQRYQNLSSDPAIAPILNNNTLTRREVSEAIEQIMRYTGFAGKNNSPFDKIFGKDILHFSTDSSWDNQYRQEQDAIMPIDDARREYIINTLSGAYDVSERRFNDAQTYLYAWQKAIHKVGQYERIAYTATSHFKGLVKYTERATNLALIASFGGMMAYGNPMLFTSLLLTLYARYKFKPWLVHEQKQWTQKRIKALQRLKETKSLDGIYQKAMERGIPTEYELGRMLSQGEEVNFWLEDMAQAEAPDDWFPENDSVISAVDKLTTGFKERLTA